MYAIFHFLLFALFVALNFIVNVIILLFYKSFFVEKKNETEATAGRKFERDEKLKRSMVAIELDVEHIKI